jgi:hypothetical protein
MSMIPKANNFSKNVLGRVGRPVAVGAAAGLGLRALAPKLGVEALQGTTPAVVAGVVTAAAVEGVFYLFGDNTPEMNLEAAKAAIEKLSAEQVGSLDAVKTANEAAHKAANDAATARAEAETLRKQFEAATASEERIISALNGLPQAMVAAFRAEARNEIAAETAAAETAAAPVEELKAPAAPKAAVKK